MLLFLGRRLLQLIPTLFFVSVIIFGLQQLLPGDPALAMAGEERDPAVQKSRMEELVAISRDRERSRAFLLESSMIAGLRKEKSRPAP